KNRIIAFNPPGYVAASSTLLLAKGSVYVVSVISLLLPPASSLTTGGCVISPDEGASIVARATCVSIKTSISGTGSSIISAGGTILMVVTLCDATGFETGGALGGSG